MDLNGEILYFSPIFGYFLKKYSNIKFGLLTVQCLLREAQNIAFFGAQVPH